MEKQYKEITAESKAYTKEKYADVRRVQFIPMRETDRYRLKHKNGDIITKKWLFGLLGTTTKVIDHNVVIDTADGEYADMDRLLVVGDKIYLRPIVCVDHKNSYTPYEYFDTDEEAFARFEEVKRLCKEAGNPIN